ncbi:MAG TPA: nodulation protein NfeD, partial [Thermoanaerobaculia bacterium]|nr:nodulation protein NfeD [Thermoanaerobaculia bacterium]
TSAFAESAAEPPPIVRVRLDSIIQPVAARFLIGALDRAQAANAGALVIELNTPGGLLTSTREIFTAMMSSEVPVIVYVAPSGARAASGGFFLLMAADVAAMAPGTNTGAAHPVGPGGESVKGVMGEKLEEDSAATIRSLAKRNGHDPALAQEAVLKSKSFTAQEALRGRLIDLVAPSFASLLHDLDGREVQVASGRKVRIETAKARVETLRMSSFERLMSALAHPNIAYLLMTLGGLGLFFELSHPGAVLPGVVGATSLILGCFALALLPVNLAGTFLILLAFGFFIAEVKIPSYGLLTTAGLISLILGSIILFRTPEPALRVSLELVIAVGAMAAGLTLLLARLAWRAARGRVRTGLAGLIHELGKARTDLTPAGKVFVHGEIWDAVASEHVPAGRSVEVTGVEGMRLNVRPSDSTRGASSTPPDDDR